ncbi:hypothetical protein SCHPADRAFT_945298 [Schizopora paradoxa]|uniref:BAH-domain-containing protein n=1 Tax=Schizopora paradoxa TaxID=27342 RepID=A0A0H2R6K9_9AGAM|nr:hypothetical protein SCHPADRAFT_945298 [Schizopora paradoxa]
MSGTSASPTDSHSSEVHVTLKNGEQVRINDHVYCSPPWSIRDGTPYSVARIMEFLPPEDKRPRGTVKIDKGKGKSKEAFTRVRLAWYYRPSDVSDRAVADSRLLLAAIYSEVCDINHLRSKCYVMHKDKLADLSGWKKKPDHFYFHRLFDPYIKKEFEVLLSTNVRNLPAHIKEVLVLRYEYVVAEKEVTNELTDSLRLCQSCMEWCAHLESVQCARCKEHFHMSCVSPPLIAKPARGYGWTCAPCSRWHEDRVDSVDNVQTPQTQQSGSTGNRETTPKSTNVASAAPVISANASAQPISAKPARGRGRPRKEKPGMKQSSNEEDLKVKHYRMWPFRYFGMYTVAEDTLDADDLIFPRAAIRTGPKNQVTISPSADICRRQFKSASNAFPIELEERGGDSTIEVLGLIHEFNQPEVETLEALMLKLATRKDMTYSVDWLTEVIRRVSDAHKHGRGLETVNMRSSMRLEKWKKHDTRYTDREWNHDEIAAFEDGISQFGAELRSVRDEVGTRTMPEVVRFYGKWKNGKLREENVRLREPEAYTKSEIPRSGAASPANGASTQSTNDDDTSVVNIPASKPGSSSRTSTYCAACRTRDSPRWWKAPRSLSSEVLCEECGLNWRKYADLNARPTTREETALSGSAAPNGANGVGSGLAKLRPTEKRPLSPQNGQSGAKRIKISGASPTGTTPPPTTTQLRCLSCYKHGPAGKVLKCRECGFQVHAGVCGATVDRDDLDGWACELCQNDKTQDASLDSDCRLCPRPRPGSKPVPNPPSDTYLRACKPTEGHGWVHVLCAVFIPEVEFADTETLKPVEGLSTIPKHRWTTTDGGAVIRCANCPKEYHVSCAWKMGHKFGFELQPVKSSRRDITTMVSFKHDYGLMNAVVCCKEHSSYRREMHNICDTDDWGNTALEVYVRAYKQAGTAETHSLLRKARRLDQILSSTNGDASGSDSESNLSVDVECEDCHSQSSPSYHPHPKAGRGKYQCHRCFFKCADEKHRP